MKRAALFIGINDYKEPLTKLSCAREDASELYQLFLKEYTTGLVHFLPDPDSDDIIEKIEYLVNQLDTGDLFLIYFSISRFALFQYRKTAIGKQSPTDIIHFFIF